VLLQVGGNLLQIPVNHVLMALTMIQQLGNANALQELLTLTMLEFVLHVIYLVGGMLQLKHVNHAQLALSMIL